MKDQKEKVEQMTLMKGNQAYKIDKKIIQFSQLLEFCYEDEQNQNKGNELIFNVPQQIIINDSIINVIQLFMTDFDYNPKRIQLRKVQAYFFKKDPKCIQEVKKFIQKNLAFWENEALKQLISFCRYFQIKTLLDVIYFHLAQKYTFSYSAKLAQQQLEKYKIQKMTEQQTTQLKLQYFDFFKKLSKQYKDIKQERQKIKEEIKNKQNNNNQSQGQNN